MSRTYARGARVAVVALAFAVSSCGSDSAKPSEEYCNDLKDGLSVFQIYEGVKDQYPNPAEFADLAYGFASISCPEQLKTNEGLRGYLEAWGINPDV